MAILEEEVLEENTGKTQEEIDEQVEVKEAEQAQALVVNAFGGGIDHQTLMRYDQMAHHLSHQIASKKLAEAEHAIAKHWDPIDMQHKDDFTALQGVESIKGHVLAPVIKHKTDEARHSLENQAADLMRDGLVEGGQNRDDIREQFCGTISLDVTGQAYHPVAVEVFEQMVAPISAQPEQQVAQAEPAQEQKAEEQIEEEEQKQSA